MDGMKIIKLGDIVPYGLWKRDTGSHAMQYGIRIPMFVGYGNVYNGCWDQMERGWWAFNVAATIQREGPGFILRFHCAKLIISKRPEVMA